MGYVKMADILKPVTVGTVTVDIMDYTKKRIGFREAMSGLTADRYARLLINGEVMMSETPMERRTNSDFVCHAHGDVLIGGLGLGMIVLAIQDDPDVFSITVIEKSKDVLAAVRPQLPLNSKVEIVEGDVFTYKPVRRFDCVYMDIWFYPDDEAYEEMKALKRRYGHYLKPKDESPKRFNKCWAEYYARSGRRLI